MSNMPFMDLYDETQRRIARIKERSLYLSGQNDMAHLSQLLANPKTCNCCYCTRHRPSLAEQQHSAFAQSTTSANAVYHAGGATLSGLLGGVL